MLPLRFRRLFPEEIRLLRRIRKPYNRRIEHRPGVTGGWMILRRIAHQLQQQQWTAVMIELAIVILGVFLGFQVSDWANERANRSAEVRHLEEIAEDLRADADAFDLISRSAEMRISGIDYLLGETRGVSRPTRVVTPTGDSFDMPAGQPVTEAERTNLLARANLVRSTGGNRTGFEALLGAGGMQKIRDRQISRQLQVYYAQLDEMTELTVILKQLRAEGVAIGHTLGLSAFGEMDPDRLTAIVRGSPAYSAYLRTNREWAAVYLSTVNQQQERARKLLADIEEYLGTRARP
jgi:hypothetical protein